MPRSSPRPSSSTRGEQRSAEYLALNPRGQVPVLVDDGEVITQIVAILLHLDAKFPQAGILPASGHGRAPGRCPRWSG
ncbi:MAG: glutathione S-transferase N-terminal domain-containing protein [Comamonadaceae bacterium]|nr:glutathione S-transferase N-terminal domain-containing protein [Comamonadaceae bacterium]